MHATSVPRVAAASSGAMIASSSAPLDARMRHAEPADPFAPKAQYVLRVLRNDGRVAMSGEGHSVADLSCKAMLNPCLDRSVPFARPT